MRYHIITMITLNIFIVFVIIFQTASGQSLDLRVVNGTRAEPNEFPFMVSIRTRDGSHLCGGTILNPMWILTAGHCAAGIRPNFLNIQYGVSRITKIDLTNVSVSEIAVYYGYVLPTVQHDIGLMRLQRPLIFGQSVQAIRLPRMYELTPEDSRGTLIGWGLNASRGRIQKNLQKVELQVYSREECNKRHLMQIHPTNICAGIEGGGKGQCNGDSGGPLIVNGRQVGITSWSMKPCGSAPYPGVYTEVANYIDWINYIMQEAEDDDEDQEVEEDVGFSS